MARKQKGRAAKAAKAKTTQEPDEVARAPHTFVIKRGVVGRSINNLMVDMRKVMEPYTASQLKVGKNNVLKDYISIAGPLHVSHMISFSKSEIGPNLRIIRLPRGPTLTFRIQNMSLMRDVVSQLKKPQNHPKQYDHPPLLVLNNFKDDQMENRLTTTILQSMFPSLNVTKIKLNTVRRCVLFNFDAESGKIEFRHYNVRATPHGMSKVVKKIVRGRIPDMSGHQDISDFLTQANNNASESEAEDIDPENKISLPQPISSRGNMPNQVSSIRLTELGPRMSLELTKIEEEICSGDILYHKYIQKSEQEVKELRRARILRQTKKADLTAQQDRNVKNKKRSQEEHQERCIEGHNKRTRLQTNGEHPEGSDRDSEDNYKEKVNVSDDDDEAWFEEEVGEKPEPGMMSLYRGRGGFRSCRGSFRGSRGRSERGRSSGRGFGRNRNDSGGFGLIDRGFRGSRGRIRGWGSFGEDRFEKRGSSHGRGSNRGRIGTRERGGGRPILKATAFHV